MWMWAGFFWLRMGRKFADLAERLAFSRRAAVGHQVSYTLITNTATVKDG
jgi:hypothetical protein